VGAPTSDQKRPCTRCGETLDLSEFGLKYPDREYRLRRCRACVREISRMHYHRDPASYKARVAANNKRTTARNRERVREFLRNANCKDCGLRDFAVLEFDHREPRDKRDDVSSLVRQHHCWPSILKEIAKCDVVCANCHRRRTARYFGWRKLLGLEELVLPPLPMRGTPTYQQIKNTRNMLRRRHRNRSHLLAFLREHPCELCGEADPIVLDFDHLRDKLHHVTDIALRGGGWSNLLAEIEKCRVLCANCHRRHTAATAGRDR
jgi:hypothetical protein